MSLSLIALISAYCKHIVTQPVKFYYCNSSLTPALFSPGMTTGNAALGIKDRLFYFKNLSYFNLSFPLLVFYDSTENVTILLSTLRTIFIDSLVRVFSPF